MEDKKQTKKYTEQEWKNNLTVECIPMLRRMLNNGFVPSAGLKATYALRDFFGGGTIELSLTALALDDCLEGRSRLKPDIDLAKQLYDRGAPFPQGDFPLTVQKAIAAWEKREEAQPVSENQSAVDDDQPGGLIGGSSLVPDGVFPDFSEQMEVKSSVSPKLIEAKQSRPAKKVVIIDWDQMVTQSHSHNVVMGIYSGNKDYALAEKYLHSTDRKSVEAIFNKNLEVIQHNKESFPDKTMSMSLGRIIELAIPVLSPTSTAKEWKKLFERLDQLGYGIAISSFAHPKLKTGLFPRYLQEKIGLSAALISKIYIEPNASSSEGDKNASIDRCVKHFGLTAADKVLFIDDSGPNVNAANARWVDKQDEPSIKAVQVTEERPACAVIEEMLPKFFGESLDSVGQDIPEAKRQLPVEGSLKCGTFGGVPSIADNLVAGNGNAVPQKRLSLSLEIPKPQPGGIVSIDGILSPVAGDPASTIANTVNLSSFSSS